MRILRVEAKAFGPFRDRSLELARGMTVVHGRNESGKSSWCAALLAALCGVRRKRGRGTSEEVEFANRHRPWDGGRTWQVNAELELDDGTVVELEQDLGPGGASRATEKRSGLDLTRRLTSDGAVDASTLLGLDRDAVPALLFVRQADVLRVLDRANGLQHYLEKAATSLVVDSTADEAIERIKEYRSENTGHLRAGSRRPLALATEAREQAARALHALHEKYGVHGERLAGRREAGARLATLRDALAEVREHEELRGRVERWRAFRALEKRLLAGRELTARLASAPAGDGPPHELVEAARAALAAHENRPAHRELEGDPARALQEELAGLPDMPSGDTRPAGPVVEAHERWRRAGERLSEALASEPERGKAPELPVGVDEVRRLADALERDVPGVDPGLEAEIARVQARVDAGRRTPAPGPAGRLSPARRLVLACGVLAVAGGVASLLAEMRGLAGALAAAGVVLLLSALVGARRGRGERGGSAAVVEPSEAEELGRLKARLQLQAEAADEARRVRDAARGRSVELGLSAEPEALRELAADAEAAARAAAAFDSWRQQCEQLRAREAESAAELLRALEERGASVDRADPDRPDPEAAMRSYVEACESRAARKEKASRRADLEARLAERRAAEERLAAERAARLRAEEQLRRAASEAELTAEDLDEAAHALRSWLVEQEEQAALRKKRDEDRARLEQLLEGKPLRQLEEELEKRRSELPAEPECGVDASLARRDAELADLESQCSTLERDIARQDGELSSLEKELGSMAEALEAEQRAASEHRGLESLDGALAKAAELLAAARGTAHASLAPVIDRMLLPWIRRITDGRYVDVRVDPDTLEVKVHDARGAPREARLLSHGTAEQMFLLLRVALSGLLATTGETPPLILDDVLVQSDSPRTRALLELLHELSTERQVILFSQEEEVLTWAEGCLRPDRDVLRQLPSPSNQA